MMKEMTDSKNCLKSNADPETYLAWADMEWDKFGFIEEYEVSVQTMCRDWDGITSVWLPDQYWSMPECMQTCEKLNKAGGPIIDTVEEIEQWNIRQMKYAQSPGGTPTAWISWTDEQSEEEWRDFLTGFLQCLKHSSLITFAPRRGQG